MTIGKRLETATLAPLLAVVLLSSGVAAPARAQSTPPPAVPVAPEAPQNLREYEGHYSYRDGLTLFMVEHDGRLVAVLNEAPYPLRPTGPDTFTNPSGQPIPFQRDARGRITGFSEAGDSFERLSATVPQTARDVLIARPAGPDGRPNVYRYTPPAQLGDDIPVDAAGGGLSIELLEGLVNGVANGTYPHVRSLLVHHKGELIFEEYFYGYDQTRPHQMRSFTKSVIALLAGAAADRGLLRPDEPALARLGYAAYRNPDPRKARITLNDLLSNQSGLDCDDYADSPGHESKLYETEDWVKAFVDLPMVSDPGTVGRYCSGGFFTAARVIERAAGKPLPEFAQEVLFGPLGMNRDNWQWRATFTRSERNEFGQIHLRPRDMLKLGILIAQRGEWQRRRVISASWLDAATGHVSRVDDSDYGLGIWHRWYNVAGPVGARRVDTIMLSGNGGQKVYLVPSLDLIVVATGAAFNVESPINRILVDVIFPALLK